MKDALPFAALSLLATVVYLVLLISLHVLPTGYEPARNAVSDYALGRFGKVFKTALWASSVGVVALAIGLDVEVGAPRLSREALLLLGLTALARVGMARFPTSLEGQKLTRTALVHYACAIIAFAFTYVAIRHLTPPLELIHPWSTVSSPLRRLADPLAVELVLIVVTMIGPLRRVFGIAERLFLLTTNVWFVFVASALVVSAR